jgi:DNA polymerase IV (DinB-like DNA polymerase)
MAILKSHDFPFQQVSIDEAFLDVSAVRNYSEATDLAERIRNDIRTHLGLTCSIGIAPTKIVAKIASDVNKPDGLTVVEPENLFSFLAPMPVRKIPGVGRKAEAELFEMGIADRMPNTRASYEQVETTPRPVPFLGSAPMTTGFPLRSEFSRISTEA